MMKRWMAVLGIVFLWSPAARAEDPVYFADGSLKAAVEGRLGKTDPTPTDMLALTRLDAGGQGITDLTGLEYATNLGDLLLYDNQISDISPLAGLTNLTNLLLSDNEISDLSPLAGLTNLIQLDLTASEISDLSPLAGLTNLINVVLGTNEISDLSPLAGLTNLTSVNLYRNQISDLSPLAGLTNLTYLSLTYNQISDISSLVGLTNLSHLYLRKNPLNPAACSVYIPQIINNNPGITISYDPCVGAAVPNVVGMTQAEAETALIAAGFIVGNIWWGPSDLPEGTVFAQNPAGGEIAAPGLAVDLTVSQGGSGPLVPGAGCLIAHWKLDETSGDVVFDSVGQNDGVTYGEPLWQPAGGKIGGALQFDGVNDYAQLPIGPVIGSLTDSTFATWVNWSGGSDGQRIFDFGGGQINMFLTPCAAGIGRMRFAITQAGARSMDQTTAPQALTAGWHHVAVTIDAAAQTYRLYLDGQVVATKTESQYTPSSLGDTTQNWLGRSQEPAAPYFHGLLDDFRIYGCALSAAEVAQLTAEVPPDPSLLAHWKLDETGGVVVFDSAGQNDGVTYGEPLWQPAGGKIGGALQFDGVNDYAQLPIGSVINSLTNSTFATWVNWSGTGGDWQRVFDFGGTASVNMFFTPCNGQTGSMRFAITNAGESGQDRVTAAQALGTGWHHVAVTIDAAGRTYRLYVDGRVVATKTAGQYTPNSLGNTTRNWLGKSQWSADPYFHGSLDDFRIYNRVLSAREIQRCMLTAAAPGGGAITVENFSFELPGTAKVKGWDGACSDPAWTGLVYDIPGWRSDSAAFDSGVETGFTPTDGLWTAFLKAGDPPVWQLTNHTIASGEVFELKVDAGNNWHATTLLIVLYYDHAGVRRWAADQEVNITDTMHEYTLTFNAAYAPASVGKKIGIEFTNVTPDPASWLGLDNVRLTLVE